MLDNNDVSPTLMYIQYAQYAVFYKPFNINNLFCILSDN